MLGTHRAQYVHVERLRVLLQSIRALDRNDAMAFRMWSEDRTCRKEVLKRRAKYLPSR